MSCGEPGAEMARRSGAGEAREGVGRLRGKHLGVVVSYVWSRAPEYDLYLLANDSHDSWAEHP